MGTDLSRFSFAVAIAMTIRSCPVYLNALSSYFLSLYTHFTFCLCFLFFCLVIIIFFSLSTSCLSLADILLDKCILQ